MDELRESFRRIKEDISFLKEEISRTKEGLSQIGSFLYDLNQEVLYLKREGSFPKKGFETKKDLFNTGVSKNETDNTDFNPQKPQNMGISNGNEGVQTDRQTDRQTDKKEVFGRNLGINSENSFDGASKLLESLDGLKKEIRIKFKKLTSQELLVFSTIYQMEEEKGFSDYKSLSARLNLTESSLRDYVRRLIIKGIPLEKLKINNKEVHLSISKNLKKITSLSTILKLVEL